MRARTLSVTRPASLQALRRQIDQVDSRLLRLLNQRAALALRVGRIKKRHGRRLFDLTRERAILHRMTRTNGGPLSAQAIRRIYRAVLTQVRRLEQTQ